MPDVPYHYQTHRRKGAGGTDPVPIELSYVFGHDDSVGGSVTTDREFEFSVVRTNDGDVFQFDPADPEGIVISRRGLYRFHATVHGGVNTTGAGIYVALQPLASGPGAGSGNSIADAGGAVASHLWNTGTIVVAGTQLVFQCVYLVTGATKTDPYRAALWLTHTGNWGYGSFNSGLYIERIAGVDHDDPPLPPGVS